MRVWAGIIGFVLVLFIVATLFGDDSSDGEQTATPIPRAITSTAVERTFSSITYRISVSERLQPVSLTYTNIGGNTEQHDAQVAEDNPWELTFPATPGAFIYISAQNKFDHGVVICEILLDGIVVETARSSGAYVIATCSGTVPR